MKFLKQQIKRSFSRAATSYDTVAHFQRAVANELILSTQPYLMPIKSEDCNIDLGCGTGYLTTQLKQQFPNAQYVGVDLALPMLNQAKNTLHATTHWINADADHLPIPNESCDRVFSSLMLQWLPDTSQTFNEIHRILKPGGQCFFTTLISPTLPELAQAWKMAASQYPTQQFIQQNTLRNTYHNLYEQFFQIKTYTNFYDHPLDLIYELKTLGANNANPARAQGLCSAKKLIGVCKNYEHFRNHQGYPATYTVYFGVLQK